MEINKITYVPLYIYKSHLFLNYNIMHNALIVNKCLVKKNTARKVEYKILLYCTKWDNFTKVEILVS